MTSQKHQDQKTQDDSYSNRDSEAHSEVNGNEVKQPGPKQEKKVSINSEPQEEVQKSYAPDSESTAPEKSISK